MIKTGKKLFAVWSVLIVMLLFSVTLSACSASTEANEQPGSATGTAENAIGNMDAFKTNMENRD